MEKLPRTGMGLVFSGGGIKAACSATATLIVLEEMGVEVKAISASSGGALIAALYCSGLNGLEVKERLIKIKLKNYFDPDKLGFLKAFFTGFKGWSGFLKGKALHKWLKDGLKVKTFEEARMPCYIVTVNVTKSIKDEIGSGDLALAALGSAAIPFVFKAVKINNEFHVDGGAISNVPADTLAEKEPGLKHILISSTQDLTPHNNLNYEQIMENFFTPWSILGNWIEAIVREERSMHLDTCVIPNTMMRVRAGDVDFFSPEKIGESIETASDFIREFLTKRM